MSLKYEVTDIKTFAGVFGILKHFPQCIKIDINKDGWYIKAMVAGSSMLVLKLKSALFTKYLLEQDMVVYMDINAVSKICSMITGDKLEGFIDDKDFSLKVIKKYGENKYSIKQDNGIDFSDQEDIITDKPQALKFSMETKDFRSVLTNMTSIEENYITFIWDANGVKINSPSETALASFSTWFKKEGVNFVNLGKGKATFQIGLIKDVITPNLGDSIFINIFINDGPITIENYDKTKFDFRFVTAPMILDPELHDAFNKEKAEEKKEQEKEPEKESESEPEKGSEGELKKEEEKNES